MYKYIYIYYIIHTCTSTCNASNKFNKYNQFIYVCVCVFVDLVLSKLV